MTPTTLVRAGVLPIAVAFATLVAPVGPGAPTEALAAGSSSKPSDAAAKCKRGQVYSKRRKRCVRDDSASLTSDDRFETGRAMAYAGRYEDALTVLASADVLDKRVLNYMGFASRKAGRVDEAMGYYQAALSIDPDYTLARSYMGQALVNEGDAAGAREQLARIEAVKGKLNVEYAELRTAMERAGMAAR